jgi:predicted outer membrane repeat protein
MSVSTRAARRLLSLFTATALLAGLMVGTPSAARAGAVVPTQYVAVAGNTYVGAFAADCNSTTFKADSFDDNEEVDSAVAAAAGGTVYFCAGDYFFTGVVNPGDSELVGASAASTSISGSEITRMFVTMGNIVLSGLTLRDGSSTGYGGGAILAIGDVTVNDAVFTDNFSDSGGGAIAAEGAVTVTDSVFTNNSTTDRGGAIGSYGYVTVLSSRFTNNSSIADENCVGGGGAIAAFDDVFVDDGSIFTGNTAVLGEATDVEKCNDALIYGGTGGAILTAEFGLIYDSTFSNNSATYGGGAIFALALGDAPTTDVEGVIVRSSFVGNSTSTDLFIEFGGAGNAVYQLNDDLYISGSSFSSNTGPGSAVMVAGNGFGGTAVVEDSVFTRNTGVFGGAIGAESVLVSGSTFTANSAEWSGGAITAVSINVDRSSFTVNSALRGGALFYCGESSITNSSFTRNVAERGNNEIGPDAITGLGGAVAGYDGTLTLIANRFTGNRASVAGGAVWLESDAAESLAVMSKNRFTTNRAGRAGGAVGYNTLLVEGSVPSRGELRAAQRQNRFSGNRGGRSPLIGGFVVPLVF